MKLVSCGADGALWAINSERFTFCLDRESKEWNQMPGSFKQVSVGSKKHVWGVDSKDCIYKWKKGTWQVCSFLLSALSLRATFTHILCAIHVTEGDRV